MNKVIRFSCQDKKDLLQAFVTSEALVNPEESIMPFSQKLELLVTKTNKTRVPISEKIALATGRAKLSRKGSSTLGIRVADDGDCARVTLTIKNKDIDLTEDQWNSLNRFLDELEYRGYHFERKWA